MKILFFAIILSLGISSSASANMKATGGGEVIILDLTEPVAVEKIGLFFNDQSALRPIALELRELMDKQL